MGYCIFNNIAIAAKHALEVRGLQRVAIVDYDVHHGNGTQRAFYDDDRVLFISLHQDSNYPIGSGTTCSSFEGWGCDVGGSGTSGGLLKRLGTVCWGQRHVWGIAETAGHCRKWAPVQQRTVFTDFLAPDTSLEAHAASEQLPIAAFCHATALSMAWATYHILDDFQPAQWVTAILLRYPCSRSNHRCGHGRW
jgi:hypothetical protein